MKTPPIQVNHLFKPLDDQLIELLSSLTEEEWQKPTIAKLWTVKDIAAHLLDGNIRTVSIQRDKYFGDPPNNIQSYNDLLAYLNQLNADWVKAMKRTSSKTLLFLLQSTSDGFIDTITSLSPFEKAMFSVAWAGEQESLNWFHVAREYMEKFIHQQQIRDAVGKEGIITKQFFHPFIDTFMYGMPYTFKDVGAAKGTTIQVTIATEAGGDWFLEKGTQGWQLIKDCTSSIAAQVIIEPDTAWKLFSKGIPPQQARGMVTFNGDVSLAEHALNLVAVMA